MFVSLEQFAGVDRVIIMVVGCGFGEDVGPFGPTRYFPSGFICHLRGGVFVPHLGFGLR